MTSYVVKYSFSDYRPREGSKFTALVSLNPTKERTMKKWECIVCGWIYEEDKGWPEDGIAPGTKWEDVPSDWLCPDCGVGKEDFEMIEI